MYAANVIMGHVLTKMFKKCLDDIEGEFVYVN